MVWLIIFLDGSVVLFKLSHFFVVTQPFLCLKWNLKINATVHSLHLSTGTHHHFRLIPLISTRLVTTCNNDNIPIQVCRPSERRTYLFCLWADRTHQSRTNKMSEWWMDWKWHSTYSWRQGWLVILLFLLYIQLSSSLLMILTILNHYSLSLSTQQKEPNLS